MDLRLEESGSGCQISNSQEGQLDAIAGIRIITSMLGLLGSASIIILAFLRRRVFSAEVHPIFMLSFADCILDVMWIVGSGLWWSVRDESNLACYSMTILTEILLCVTISLTFVYALFAYLRTKDTELPKLMSPHPVIQKEIGRKFLVAVYLTAWLLPTVIVLLVFGGIAGKANLSSLSSNSSCRCVPTLVNVVPYAWGMNGTMVEFQHSVNHLMTGFGSIYLIYFVIAFVGLVVLYLKILRKIKKLTIEHEEQMRHDFGTYSSKETLRLIHGQAQARKRIVMFLTTFLLSGLCSILLAAFLIGFLDEVNKDLKNGEQTVFDSPEYSTYIAFLYAQSVTLPLQGFFNAIVYGWTREDFVHIVALQLTSEVDVNETTPIIVNPQELSSSYEVGQDGRFQDTYMQSATSCESEAGE